MGIFDGCLLACDIDGTLVENGYINPICIEKIKFFVSEGGKFVIATGRSVGAVSIVTDAIDCISTSVVANGAMIFDFTNDKIVKEYLLPKSDCFLVEYVLDSVPDIGIEIHSGKKVLIVNPSSEIEDHVSYEKLSVDYISLDEAKKYDWTKILFAFSDIDERKKLRESINSFNVKSDMLDTAAFIEGKTRYYLEIVPKGVSKAESLDELCTFLNIRKCGFFAIGDYFNDVKMLENADISATTSDAPDEIKKITDFVGGSCRDGAVADFIDYLTEIFRN